MASDVCWPAAVPFGRVRLDLGGRNVARERLDLALLGGQLEVHGRRIESRPCWSAYQNEAVPPGRAGRPKAASSVTPVASGYERDTASFP
jgi:hypothetical protein